MKENINTAYYRDRAAREIALAQATGSKAHASPDFRTVFIERKDGSTERVHLRDPNAAPN
jgi:hypothetical protein